MRIRSISRRLALEPLLAPVDQHAADRRVGLHGDLGILDPPRLDDLELHPLDGADNLQQALPFEIIGLEARRADEEREATEEIHEHLR